LTFDRCPIEIDECATGKAACGSHSTCVNTAGAYRCECEAGYEPSLHSPFTCDSEYSATRLYVMIKQIGRRPVVSLSHKQDVV